MKIWDILQDIRPGAEWKLDGSTYEGLVWLDTEQSKPSKQEVEDALQRYEYRELRRKEYPNFSEQFDLLYHEGYDGWKAIIKAIKDKYPKI